MSTGLALKYAFQLDMFHTLDCVQHFSFHLFPFSTHFEVSNGSQFVWKYYENLSPLLQSMIDDCFTKVLCLFYQERIATTADMEKKKQIFLIRKFEINHPPPRCCAYRKQNLLIQTDGIPFKFHRLLYKLTHSRYRRRRFPFYISEIYSY